MQKLEFETILVEAARLPYVRIDRESFLRKELKMKYSPDIIAKAVKHNPAYAGIEVEEINKIAKTIIKVETAKVTALSAAAGLPGGPAMLGTVPADMAQYFGHIIRVLQELIYLYGWEELNLDADNMSEETKYIITLFVGVMFGVNGAMGTVNKLAAQMTKQTLKKLPQKALTKGAIFPVAKKVATGLGIKMTKDSFSQSVAKAIPGIGALVSGGLTYVSFKPMSEKLRKHLADSKLADAEFYKNSDIA